MAKPKFQVGDSVVVKRTGLSGYVVATNTDYNFRRWYMVNVPGQQSPPYYYSYQLDFDQEVIETEKLFSLFKEKVERGK